MVYISHLNNLHLFFWFNYVNVFFKFQVASALHELLKIQEFTLAGHIVTCKPQHKINIKTG